VFVMQGATIVDQIVAITPVENYVPNRELQVFPLSSYSNLFQMILQNIYVLECNLCRK
jgi:hypothetical protein